MAFWGPPVWVRALRAGAALDKLTTVTTHSTCTRFITKPVCCVQTPRNRFHPIPESVAWRRPNRGNVVSRNRHFQSWMVPMNKPSFGTVAPVSLQNRCCHKSHLNLAKWAFLKLDGLDPCGLAGAGFVTVATERALKA
jgi:hypothetical protein